MNDRKLFVAIDLGASSGRVILGKISKDSIEYEEIARFENGPVSRGNELFWDIRKLRQSVLAGLSKLANLELVSIGVDSWAVDYALVDSEGELLREPHHYRDERNHRGVESVSSKVSAEELFAANGLQFLTFNSLYQLAVDQDEQPGLTSKAFKALLIPDLFNLWLTGKFAAERTNASTTGLLDPSTKSWNEKLIDKLGLKLSLLGNVVSEGTYLGSITDSVARETGLSNSTQVVTVGSHDTASAFVAVPSTKPGSLFISSGTWSLLGIELDEPILGEAARKANFTNEGGVDGRVRFLKNVTGLWLLQESVRHWGEIGRTYSIEELIQDVPAEAFGSVVDVNDASFLAPGDIPARIQEFCAKSNQEVPQSDTEIVRVIFDSLIAKYQEVIQELESITGTRIERIHVVGGGSQNDLLNQLTANATGLEVYAGPVEATAIGNLVVQARAAKVLSGSLEDLRALIARSFEIRKFTPELTGGK
jgi:rhamnulokinase